jgi:hypothetical protein
MSPVGMLCLQVYFSDVTYAPTILPPVPMLCLQLYFCDANASVVPAALPFCRWTTHVLCQQPNYRVASLNIVPTAPLQYCAAC